MDTATLLREYVKTAHGILDGTLGETTAAQATWQPEGDANSIAVNYAHLVVSEDMLVNAVAKGEAPLLTTTMAGKTGMSEPPPRGHWTEWAQQVQIDLPALRAYGQAVFANTDSFLAGLSEEDLGRTIDLTNVGFGMMPLPLFVMLLVGGHTAMHAGEISCLKGLQGMKGYPF